MTDSFENAALVERLRGPLPSVYVPFGDDGDMAWDGVLSRERQLRERLEAADEIERLRRWQGEARYVIDAWDEVYETVPGWFRDQHFGWMHADVTKAYMRTLLDGEA